MGFDLKFWFGLGLALLSFALSILGAPSWLVRASLYLGVGITALCVGVAAVGSSQRWLKNSLQRKNWPNFDKWDQRKDFRLWEAANLWVDQEPQLPLSRQAELIFRKFEIGLRDKTLSVRREDLREVIADAYDYHEKGKINKANPNWSAKRQDLINYAVCIGAKPRFLFPKERT